MKSYFIFSNIFEDPQKNYFQDNFEVQGEDEDKLFEVKDEILRFIDVKQIEVF